MSCTNGRSIGVEVDATDGDVVGDGVGLGKGAVVVDEDDKLGPLDGAARR